MSLGDVLTVIASVDKLRPHGGQQFSGEGVLQCLVVEPRFTESVVVCPAKYRVRNFRAEAFVNEVSSLTAELHSVVQTGLKLGGITSQAPLAARDLGSLWPGRRVKARLLEHLPRGNWYTVGMALSGLVFAR